MKYSWQIERSQWAIQVGWVGQFTTQHHSPTHFQLAHFFILLVVDSHPEKFGFLCCIFCVLPGFFVLGHNPWGEEGWLHVLQMPGMKEAKTVVSIIFSADMKPPSCSDHIRLPAWFPVGWRCNKDLPGGWNLDSGDEEDCNEDDVNQWCWCWQQCNWGQFWQPW